MLANVFCFQTIQILFPLASYLLTVRLSVYQCPVSTQSERAEGERRRRELYVQ
jgi:hypothetical protein